MVVQFCSIAMMLLVLVIYPVGAQQTAQPLPTDPVSVQRMQQKIEELEARLKGVEALEARLNALESKQTQVEEQVATVKSDAIIAPQRNEFGLENLQIRGFGDITYSYLDAPQKERNRFALGEFSLFLQTQLSENLSVVGDIDFEAELGESEFEVEVSRLLLEYQPSRYFNVSVGRYFSNLSYYNHHYPHGAWTQTTIGRPLLLDEERGFFPGRGLGLSFTGKIPSGKLGLHYFAEVSNGRIASFHIKDRSPFSPASDVFDGKNSKAFVVGLFAQPEWFPGLRVGSGLRYDHTRFTVATNEDDDEENDDKEDKIFRGRLTQTLATTHLVYQTSTFEWLNEAFLFFHNPAGAKTTHPVAFYSQVSQQFGNLRPYLRYEYLNASNSDPVFTHIGRRHGPSLGVRYDLTTFAALKLQYDHLWQRSRNGVNGWNAQVAFAF